ncbi:MAG: hypothetical protein J0J04_04720 [Microbacterium sp.]|uniref:hypothetical protein n=1 Tax=Microbacterium sp. TaxID=51671 RepID=UPI001AC7DA1A|nr:hypothetical protein [Microbacterium sp.]MBN9214111.1 hypothetical protein [Microbacterium sp.]
MSTFDEAQHPRVAGGRFATKTNDAPTGALGAEARRMFAGVTSEGTAAGETALCTPCNTEANIARFGADDVVGRQDCTGNDALECQSCGWFPQP